MSVMSDGATPVADALESEHGQSKTVVPRDLELALAAAEHMARRAREIAGGAYTDAVRHADELHARLVSEVAGHVHRWMDGRTGGE